MTSPSKKRLYTVRTFDIIGLSVNYITLVFAITREDVLTALIQQRKSTKVVSHRSGGVTNNFAMPINLEKLMPINVEKTITI